jgi:nucleoside-diphosphate-sugar epimerase/pimeloyl-ACP methyl ester carboxylesterase
VTAARGRLANASEPAQLALRHALVFGATGFVGRHLVLALSRECATVTAAVRSEASYTRMVEWLEERDCALIPQPLLVDFEAARLGVHDISHLDQVTELHNCAGAYRFGMSNDEARHANVHAVRDIVQLASRLPALRRIVHVSGYRVGGQDPSEVPWSVERIRNTYMDLGAYEASKVESDATFQHDAQQAGLPWSIVNPSTVSGVSSSGESDQFLGLAGTLHELWQGTLSALPGDASTFVPVVPVDHLARFMTRVALDADSTGQSYWVLDADTPPLHELLTVVGEHYRVKVPRLRLPVALIKRLPGSLTKADPETLSFLSNDTYPTAQAAELAQRQGLSPLTSTPSLLAWADDLAAQRFGAAAPTRLRRSFGTYAGVRTFELGPADGDSLVLPGLPVNADTWIAVVERLAATRAVDLPGLGMTAGGPGDWEPWLAELMADGHVRRLVGHSVGTAAALEYATRHPGHVEHLTLVAPFFLQSRPGAASRSTTITSHHLRHVRPAALSAQLTGSEMHGAVLRSAVADLRRGRSALHSARLLRRCGDRRWRSALQQQLAAFPGSVHIVEGSEDVLAPWSKDSLDPLGSRLTRTTIEGAGHHPQLTHPARVAAALDAALRPAARNPIGQQ